MRILTFLSAALMFLSAPCLVRAVESGKELRYNGSATILKSIMSRAAEEFERQEQITFSLRGKSTGFGIKKLLAGECDIAGGGRPLKAEEKEKGLIETKMFLDGFVFIVHATNPVELLSTEQIKGILLGEITEWEKVGGSAGKKIIILSPSLKSAVHKSAQKIIGFKDLPEKSIVVDITPEVYQKVKQFPSSIGWLSKSNIKSEEAVKIVRITQDGEEVQLNEADLVSGRYPYSRTMFFYTMGEPEGDVNKFIDFMKGEKGEMIARESGFFPAQ